MTRLLFACLLFTSPLFAAAPLTIDDYISMPVISAVHFSPDGSRIAYVVTRPNFARATFDGEIHVIGVDGTTDITLTRSKGSDYHPRWSPDGKSIAFLSDRDGAIEIYVINVNGGEASRVTDEHTGIRNFEWSPDGKTIVFTRMDAEPKRNNKDDARVVGENVRHVGLYTIDVDTGAVRRLTEANVTAGSFAISPDGQTVAFDRAPGPGLDNLYRTDIYLMPIAGGEARPLVTQPGIDRTPIFSPDGKWIAFSSGGGVHDWLRENALFVVPVAGGAPHLVSKSYDRSPDTVFWSDDSRTIYFDGPFNTTSQLFRVNVDGSRFENLSNAAGLIGDSDVDAKRGRAAIVYQTLNDPPELYLTPLDRFAPRQLTNINAAYRGRAIGETRLIKWKNPKDGLEIEGLLTLPVGYESGRRYPLLTFVHGGPASRFDQGFLGYLSYIYPVHVFAAEGFAVLRPNPRGTGGYGESFRAANRNDWAGMDWVDINAGIDKVIAGGIADPERLGMMGWSYGGYIASWAAGHSDRFRAISIGAPVVDLLSFHGTADIRDFIPNYFTSQPLSFDLLRERSPLWRLRPTRAAILIQHGESDDRVPLSQGTMLYRVLQELGANVTMVTYPRTPHTPREPKLRMDAARRNLEFMRTYILQRRRDG